jgi:hypothetical protein
MPARSCGLSVLIAAVLLVGLAGCVTTSDGTATPRLARLSTEEMARLAPDTPRLTPDDLVSMARSGASVEAILERVRKSSARFDLTPAQVLDLHARGLPLAVLESIHEGREKALRADLAKLLVERDQKCAVEIAEARVQERQLARLGGDGCYGPLVPHRYPGALRRW